MFEVIFLDAGQGDATLVVYPDKSLMLVDCGCKKNSQIVSGEIETVLNRYLPSASNKLKALVLTHPDGDHYNLVKKLIIDKGVTVDTLVYGSQADFYSDISQWMKQHKKQIPLAADFYSDQPHTDLSYKGSPNVDVRILAANAGNPQVKTDANPNSVVLLITCYDINIFLMGDATELTEKFIVSSLGSSLDTLLMGKRTVLKAGHHGSNSSSKQAWIQKIKPKVVFISSDTRTFSGVSIPRSSVINDIKTYGQIFDYKTIHPPHHYVQYNDATDTHEQVSTTLAIFTTLYLLEFQPNNIDFTAYGTSWYYQIDNRENIYIEPACTWNEINRAY